MTDIRAAGAVVLRNEGSTTYVCLVHRPRYDDWSLPKGKLEVGEDFRTCAVRELHEETGLHVALGAPLTTTSYKLSKKLNKSVHWWRARVRDQGTWQANDEIDDVRWLPAKKALKALTYPDEASVLHEALELPPTHMLALVRHGKALPRTAWGGPDPWRPLNARGRNHAKTLAHMLNLYGVDTLVSSPSTRCRQSFGVTARQLRISIEDCPPLSEESFDVDEAAAADAMTALLKRTEKNALTMAVCGHRPVLPTMAETLGLKYSAMKTGQALIGHFHAGEALRQELFRQNVDGDD